MELGTIPPSLLLTLLSLHSSLALTFNPSLSYSSSRPGKSASVPEPAVFLCISMLARAVGSNIEAAIKPILDQMFSVGLSIELTSALKVLAQEIPNLQKEIQGS